MKANPFGKLEFEKIKAFLIEEAKTQPGKERLKELTPFFSLSVAQHESAKVKEAQRLLAERGRLPLPELEALSDFLKEIALGQALNIGQLALIRRYLRTYKDLKAHLRGLPLPRLKGMLAGVPDLKDLLVRLNEVLEPDDQGVRTEASPRLKEIRQGISRTEKLLRERLRNVLQKASRAGYLQEEIITQRRGRYVLPVKAEAKHKVPGILHDTSASGATVYIEPASVITLANELEALYLQEEREVLRILTELTTVVLKHAAELFSLEAAIAELDSLQARALFGERIKGSLPELVKEGDLRLLEAAHPLLLLSGRRVVRNDFIFPADRPVVVISGPNLGGKTVSLKTVGLLCLMAQAGIPIPASPDSCLPVFEAIVADIGDEQDLSQEESTFSAHVKRLREIICEAGPGKLFLIDEIGRGTDPAEGAALGMAVLEHLLGTGARVLATTHYEALKAFSFSRKEILPLSVSFDEETGEPTYKLTYGVAGLSRGLALARRLGLPPAVVDRAEAYLGQGAEAFKEVLENLRQTILALEQEKEAWRKKQAELHREKERLQREYEEKRARFEAQERALRAQFEEKTKALEEKFRRLAQEVRSSRKSLRRAEGEFWAALREEIKKTLPEERSHGPLVPGARVKLKGMDQEGCVLRIKGQVAEVQLGPFKVEVAVKDLVVLPEEGPGHAAKVSVKASTDVPTTVNLIGMRVDEALAVLDKVIDQAFLSGKPRLTVIHGLGTGRLMRAIREHLSRHAQVARIRAGRMFEGGEAVTVVELACGEEA